MFTRQIDLGILVQFFGNWVLAVGRGRPSRKTSTTFREHAGAALSGDRGVVEAMPSQTSGGIPRGLLGSQRAEA
jgi:hypothetical protein